MRHLIPPVLAASAMVLGAAPAYADFGDQLAKLLSEDGAASDQFGRCVAISGTIAIVGANLDDDNGNASGSAYLFDTKTGQQLSKLLPDDGTASSLFGWSVAINGNIAIVGALRDDQNSPNAGAAYLFDISDPANPIQLFKLLPDDGAKDDRFGRSVAISGTTAIVGAENSDENGFTDSGSAYLFDAITGQQLFKLLANDGATDDAFGHCVAISGATAIVAAIEDDDNGDNSGSVYVFDAGTGQQLFKLLPNDGAKGDNFSAAVAIRDEIAIIGARGDDDNGNTSGSAYLFDTTTGQQLSKLLANDGASGDFFGSSVAISGTTVIVGALSDDDNGVGSGSVYLFDISDAANPRQTAKLLANDGAAHDSFGSTVAISGNITVVGSWKDDDNGENSGSAYLFDASYCPGDLDGSGTTGVPDLLDLLATWGPCKGCPADLDLDGNVGVSDLLALLANWGPCP